MVDNPNSSSVPRFLKLLVLFAWIGVFWGLLNSMGGMPPIARFLSPDYWWLIKMAAAIMIIYAISTYYIVPHGMGMGALAGLVQAGLLVLPIIYLPTAVSTQFSPAAFEKRSVGKNFCGGEIVEGDRDSLAAKPPAGLKAGSVSLLDLSRRPSEFEGRRVTTEGMVYHEDALGKHRFLCYRLLMWCCAADARPIGVLVQPRTQTKLGKGQWARVEGIVEKSLLNGRRLITIKDAEVEEIDAPSTPFIFN